MLLIFLSASFGLLVLTVASLGVGSWISGQLSSTFHSLDRLALGLSGGFGFFSLVLFIVGQFSFTRKTIVIVACVVILASLKTTFSFLRRALGSMESLRRAPKIPLVIVGLILVLTAATGLNELTGDWGNDAIAYHLLGPKVWLRNGIIRPVSDNCHTAFPQTAETMYGALSALGGQRAPGFSSFVSFGMLLLVVASLAMRAGLDAVGVWWVVALVATMPAVYYGSVGCFVDGIYAAFLLGAIRIAADAEQNRDWAIFGIFCGLAMGTKYTGILAFPILLLVAFWKRRPRREDRRNAAKVAVLVICVACVVGGPYYLRNWILLGCPIYPPPPGLAHLCSPKYLSPEAVDQFHAYILRRGAGLGRGLGSFLMLPFNLTYHTSNFHGAGGIGIVPLAFGPIGLIAGRKNDLVKTLAILAFLFVIAWFVTQQESRFLIHVYILAAIIAVIGWRYMQFQANVLVRVLTVLIVVASVGYGLFMIGRGWPEGVHALISPAYAQAQRNIPYLESFQYLNRSPDVKRFLILDFTVPPYYADKEYVKPVGQWGERTVPGATTSLEALERARELGITHVLDVNSDVAPFQIAGQTKNLILVFESTNQRIYKVD